MAQRWTYRTITVDASIVEPVVTFDSELHGPPKPPSGLPRLVDYLNNPSLHGALAANANEWEVCAAIREGALTVLLLKRPM